MLLIAKIHELFTRQDPAVASIRTTGWLSVVALTGTFMLIVPLTRAIEFYCLDGDLKIGQAPAVLLYLMIMFLPMALLFTGAVITTWLFEGKVLGENIIGILE